MSLYGERRPITPDINQWSAELDTALPIFGDDIPGFAQWINGNGFNLDRDSGTGHGGFDFGAYLRNDGVVVLGLPKETPIRAVADGVVRDVFPEEYTGGPYSAWVAIEHGAYDSGMWSTYRHIDPAIKVGTAVKRGDVLGALYKDPGEAEGRLVHLHLELVDGWGTHGSSPLGGGLNLRLQNPGLIDPTIYELDPGTQDWEPFDPVRTLGAVALQVAHFQTVRVGIYTWQG